MRYRGRPTWQHANSRGCRQECLYRTTTQLDEVHAALCLRFGLQERRGVHEDVLPGLQVDGRGAQLYVFICIRIGIPIWQCLVGLYPACLCL